MKNTCCLLFTLMFLLSCNENSNKTEKGKSRALKNEYTDKLIGRENDTTYTRSLMVMILAMA